MTGKGSDSVGRDRGEGSRGGSPYSMDSGSLRQYVPFPIAASASKGPRRDAVELLAHSIGPDIRRIQENHVPRFEDQSQVAVVDCSTRAYSS